MRRISGLGAAVALVAVSVVAVLASAAGASPSTTCPPNPPPGSTVSGGLLVTGPCLLDHVNVTGGVVVTGTGHLELENSSVSGGITVQPGGELDSGHTMNSSFATYLPSTISGGINYMHGSDLDLVSAIISGKVTIAGSGGQPTICDSTLSNDLVLKDITTGAFWVGDPGEPVFVNGDCPGNTIGGSLRVTNSRNIEIEFNTINGSVSIGASNVDFRGNNVRGSASCKSSTFFSDDPPAPNTVHGSSNCP